MDESINNLDITVPAVSFSYCAVSLYKPNEFRELIDITPELKNWAETVAPEIGRLCATARGRQRIASITLSGSDRHEVIAALKQNADHLMYVFGLLRLIAAGRAYSNIDGCIDRQSWDAILKSVDKLGRMGGA